MPLKSLNLQAEVCHITAVIESCNFRQILIWAGSAKWKTVQPKYSARLNLNIAWYSRQGVKNKWTWQSAMPSWFRAEIDGATSCLISSGNQTCSAVPEIIPSTTLSPCSDHHVAFCSKTTYPVICIFINSGVWLSTSSSANGISAAAWAIYANGNGLPLYSFGWLKNVSSRPPNTSAYKRRWKN